jgi:hypothetical protein
LFSPLGFSHARARFAAWDYHANETSNDGGFDEGDRIGLPILASVWCKHGFCGQDMG